MARRSPSTGGTSTGSGDAEKRFVGDFNAHETAIYLNLGRNLTGLLCAPAMHTRRLHHAHARRLFLARSRPRSDANRNTGVGCAAGTQWRFLAATIHPGGFLPQSLSLLSVALRGPQSINIMSNCRRIRERKMTVGSCEPRQLHQHQ